MNREMIAKTEAFLKETFVASTYLQANPTERDYRLEHSYQVANIAKAIAEAEGFDVTNAVIAGLLHDIAYCEEMVSREDRMNHGRRSAAIARPFLENLGLPADAVNEICYGIAIHVDDEADFEWKRTPFCKTVGDADNIDRFDVYRVYESLQYMNFNEMPLEEKQDRVNSIIDKLTRYKDLKLGTETAKKLWIGKHQELIDKLNKGHALDLGCGIGQFTDYWINNGFQVTSADISVNALNALKERTPTATTVELDMSKPLPFEDGTFDVVFANLSIHYFDEETTLALSGEIHRILKPGGLFIGSVNSSVAYEIVKDKAKVLEDNYYLIGERYIRLFDRAQFDQFFGQFTTLSLEEIHTVRFKNQRDRWEFIFQKHNEVST